MVWADFFLVLQAWSSLWQLQVHGEQKCLAEGHGSVDQDVPDFSYSGIRFAVTP